MNFRRLTTTSEIQDLIRYHNENSKVVVCDCETTDKNPRTARLIDVQLSDFTEDGAVIFSSEFAPELSKLSPSLTLVGHSFKYDLHVLYRHGVDLLSRTWRDTLLLGHLLDENRKSYSLDSYVSEYWGSDYKKAFWKKDGGKYESYEQASEEDRIQYACSDVVYTGRLYQRVQKLLCDQAIPEALVEHVHRLQKSLLCTENNGIKIDLDYIKELGVKLKSRIDELEPEMRKVVEADINILELQAWQKEIDKKKSDKGKSSTLRPIFSFSSSKQLVDLLYGRLNLPRQFNDKTKAISTDFASLEKIKSSHPVVKLIQENRDLQKVYTAYIEGTLERIENFPGVNSPRIYPSFRVNGTTTGRISHNNPNLAQLPKEGGIRAIYVPDSGRRFISADYSQLEVVVEANLTGDSNLIRMLENGESKHDLTSRELGCDRHTAKTLNFALQYWCTAGKVSKLLGVSATEGQRIYDQYWSVYSGSKDLKYKTDKMVNSGVPLQTLFGRKRRFEQRKRSPFDGDYRQAFNFLIQGTGADLTSRSFYLTSEWLAENKLGRGLFSVHDELVIEVDENRCEEAEFEMLRFMTRVGDDLGLKVPLRAQSSGPMACWED